MKDRPYAAHNGKSLLTIARALSKDPWDVFFDACRMNAFALPQTMTEANLIKAMREEFVSFCTDVGPAGGSTNSSHPPAFGGFSRRLFALLRGFGVISLQRAILQI